MTVYFLDQTAVTDGDGSAGSPWNDPFSAEAGATQSGDIVNITPEVVTGDAVAWNLGNDLINIPAGVTWRVDPAHAASGVTNRRILPYFVRNGGPGTVLVLGAGAVLEGVRVSLGNQGLTTTNRQDLIRVGAGGQVKGCVYWAETGTWSDDPHDLYPDAWFQHENHLRCRIINVDADDVLVENCHHRLSSWMDILVSDGNISNTEIRFCDLRGTYKSQVAMPAGSTTGANTPLRGAIVEFNNLGCSTEEDNVQTFGGFPNDPKDDMPRFHGLVIQHNLMSGISGENAMDGKYGQCHLMQYNICHGHPGNDDGPYQGNDPKLRIDFYSISGAVQNYHTRWSIFRNNAIVFNAKGIQARSRAVYNNLIINNVMHGPDGTWDSPWVTYEHAGIGASGGDEDGFVCVNNIIGQHTRVNPAKDKSIEFAAAWGQSTCRINHNAYFNNQNAEGYPLFLRSAERTPVDFAEWKLSGVNNTEGGDQDSIIINDDLPVLVSAGGDNHLITSTFLPNDFDAFDWGVKSTAPAALLTGGGGVTKAAANSTGTFVTLDRSWVFYAANRYGNPGSVWGTQVPNDRVMNMRTGQIRRIVTMPTTIADITNGELTVDSAMDVQTGDEFAWVPEGWTDSFVRRGFMAWSGAGIDAATGQGGTMTNGTAPPPSTIPDGTINIASDDFAGTAGTSVDASTLEVDGVGDGWGVNLTMELDGSGALEIDGTLTAAGGKPSTWLTLGVGDPRVRARIDPDSGTRNWQLFVNCDAIVKGEPWNGYQIRIRASQQDVLIDKWTNGAALNVAGPFSVTFPVNTAYDWFVVYEPSSGTVRVTYTAPGGGYSGATLAGEWIDPSPLLSGTVAGIAALTGGTPNTLVEEMEFRSLSDASPVGGALPMAPASASWIWTSETTGTLSCPPVSGAALYIGYVDGVATSASATTSVQFSNLSDQETYTLSIAAVNAQGRIGPVATVGQDAADVQISEIILDADDGNITWSNQTGLRYAVWDKDVREVGVYDATTNPAGAVLVAFGDTATTNSQGRLTIVNNVFAPSNWYWCTVGEAMPLDGTNAKTVTFTAQAQEA